MPLTHPLLPLWQNPAAFSLNLLTAFLDMYGTEALAWAPETIEMELRDDLNIDLPPGNYDRLMTAISLVTSNEFFVSVPTFMRDCASLSGHVTPQDSMIMPDSEDIAWGITEALLICPPDDKENPFCDEIVGFVQMTLSEEGIFNPADVLKIALGDGATRNRINAEFSDDPEMFAAIQQNEQAKTDQINQTIRERLRALLQQLQSLPLTHGKTAVAQKLLAKLPAQ